MGGAVTVRAGSAVLETKVVLVSHFLEGDQSKNEIPPGKDITFACHLARKDSPRTSP